MADTADPTEWLLTPAERGNEQTRIDDAHRGQAWSEGNLVRPLIHGATYFTELYERIESTGAGDVIVFADWQGDADEQLTGEPGSEVLAVLGRAAARGVDVRGLVWHSRPAAAAGELGDNEEFGAVLRSRGVEAWLDMRVRKRGSHHQKFVVLRHRDDATRDVAFVGGIDLCHSRRDDVMHDGDPQS
ncbi:MAG: phospholipase, partial [Aeromicrobium sp.]